MLHYSVLLKSLFISYIILLSLPFIYFLYLHLSSFRLRRDYRNEDFKTITGLKFLSFAKLPTYKQFFKEKLHPNQTWLQTSLPTFDMNDYDFTDVSISCCNFTKDTILPKDKDFFQKVKDKAIIDCRLPSGDYSIYNFKDVSLNRVTFPKDAILPKEYSFFRDLSNHYCIQMQAPNSFAKDCHLYDLSHTELILRKQITVSDTQKAILVKNNSSNAKFIKEKKTLKQSLKSLFFKFVSLFTK